MIPTDEQIIKEIREISILTPQLMQCYNCKHYDRATSYCAINHFKMAPFVRGCNGIYFLAREEEMLYKAKKNMQQEEDDCQKVENLLAILITTLGAASCFNVDMSRRITKIREQTTDSRNRNLLKKDLTMAEDFQKAMDQISEITQSMTEIMLQRIEAIDQQYRLYIEPHVNRLFNKKGKWDVRKGDIHLGNQFEVCRLIGKFIKGCIGNEKNSNAVFEFLDSLENENPYALTHEDLDHYKLKGYED